MAFFVDRLQSLVDQLGIHLGGGDIAVTHQLLDRTHIGAIFQQMHSEAVAQRMRCDLLLDMSCTLVILQDLPKALAGHSHAAYIDEQGGFGGISIHLVESDQAEAYCEELKSAYQAMTGKTTETIICSIGNGARVLA